MWQSKFRRWYLQALDLEENKSLSPQEIQRKYPCYDTLKEDMLKINQELVKYTQELAKLF